MNQTGIFNFYLGYIGSLRGIGANKNIKVDIANDEMLCNDPVEKKVNNEYSDLRDEFEIKSYPIEKIITEKMRSLMQRIMPRDLYDLCYLFETDNFNIKDFIFDFKTKAEFKGKKPEKFVNNFLDKEDRLKLN